MATLSPVEQLDRAIEVALSHLQVNWSQADKVRIAQALSGLPPLYQGYPMPFSTYLLFVLEQGHLNRLCYVNALIHDTILQNFLTGTQRCRRMQIQQQSLIRRIFSQKRVRFKILRKRYLRRIWRFQRCIGTWWRYKCRSIR